MSNSTLRRRFGRRVFLAAGAVAVAMPFIARSSLAAAKIIRISTPGSPEEWQSKALEEFKKELNAAAPGQFDVQNHYNGTLFAQGTEIEAMADAWGKIIRPQPSADQLARRQRPPDFFRRIGKHLFDRDRVRLTHRWFP